VSAGPSSALERDLRALVRGRVAADADSLDGASYDYGGLVRRVPLCVVSPASVDDVVAVVRYANRAGVRVVPQGVAHSQHGQGLGEGCVALSMRSLAGIGPVDAAGASVDAQAGATWYEVADAAAGAGMIPNVLPNQLDMTVGGTMSVGGLGSTSWRYGAQVENVVALDVVTGDGDLRRCDLRHDRELFDAVRAGLGQCGVVVGATLALRPLAPRMRSYRFRCASVEAMLGGLDELLREGRAQHLLCECLPAFVGKPDGALPFELLAGVEFGDAEPAPVLASWAPSLRLIGASDAPVWGGRRELHPFVNPLVVERDRRSVRPWVHAFLTKEGAEEALAMALHPDNDALLGFINLLMPVGGDAPAPLFITPAAPRPFYVYSLLANAPSGDAEVIEAVLDVMGDVSHMLVEMGGVRYISGYMADRDAAAWAAHFGERWPWFAAMKAKYDPNRVLGGSFLSWA
jgi:cytokinin dehydrogenase